MHDPIAIPKKIFTPAVCAKFRQHYPHLHFTEHAGELIAHLEELSGGERKNFLLDTDFFLLNPTLPLENICSRLDNYFPKNSSQEDLLIFAQRLVELDDDSIGAGLYMHGEAGIGKSHIAIGISKEFMQKGLKPNFIIADRYNFQYRPQLEPGQVWIIDDMNSGFHISSRLFKEVVLNAFNCGGRVFVTSNKDYDELMKEAFVGDGAANKIRYTDRTKGMFKILHVSGESYRQANAWYL
jgi:DNA replication protein DnaC